MKTIRESYSIGTDISLEIELETYEDQELDAMIYIDAMFVILGSKRQEFRQRLSDLIEQFRV